MSIERFVVRKRIDPVVYNHNQIPYKKLQVESPRNTLGGISDGGGKWLFLIRSLLENDFMPIDHYRNTRPLYNGGQ